MGDLAGEGAADRKPWPKSPLRSVAEPGWGQGTSVQVREAAGRAELFSPLLGKHTLDRLKVRWISLTLAQYFNKILPRPCIFLLHLTLFLP